jgi:hypothetical protein
MWEVHSGPHKNNERQQTKYDVKPVYPDPDSLKPDSIFRSSAISGTRRKVKKQIVLNFWVCENFYLDHNKRAQEKAPGVILAFLDWDRRSLDPDSH